MRQNTEQRRWTGCSPADTNGLPGALTGVSLALFDTWLNPGCVVAARCPGRTWTIGTDLYGDLAVPSDMRGQLSSRDTPIFLITRRGLGLLSYRYETLTGLGLFVHFHVPVEAAAQSVNLGLPGHGYRVTPDVEKMGSELGRHDEAVYWIMSESWRQLTGLLGDFPSPDSRKTVSVVALADWVRQTSEAVGCEVKVEQQTMMWTRAVCYHPRLWEAWLLYSLLLARETSLCRHMTCELSVMDGLDGGLLASRVEFPLIQGSADSLFDDRSDTKDMAGSKRSPHDDWPEYSLNFVERAVGRNGGSATHQTSPAYPAPQDAHILCRDVTMDMCFLMDPDREPEGDVKAHIKWKEQGMMTHD